MMDDEVQNAISALRTAVQDIDRRITRAEASIEYSARSADDMKLSIAALDAKLDVIRQDIAQARGSAGTMKWIVETFKIGGAGTLGAWLASHFGGGPPPGS